ncbi:hypothetical protein A6V36_13905 [Paraburkholderia ginsengiterrae]|uniref:Uncharacterized protein n=1 Tax=Paraburkholderia ginsengiterrae TaxID=1462993 RepID=A0A1A9MXQ8_9BURK|nr:hypothetical protein A6V36_13905 [Paraburkholderia ginsengiterrae]OAJ52627.1 hypothetical protein A6V37_09295 [Paraburkholderia ginsengiterrae]
MHEVAFERTATRVERPQRKKTRFLTLSTAAEDQFIVFWLQLPAGKYVTVAPTREYHLYQNAEVLSAKSR